MSIAKPQTVKVAAFTPSGIWGDVYALHYQQQAYATPITVANLQAGLTSSYFKKYFKETKLMKRVMPDSTYILTIPETGVYSFFYTCDDGGVLRIANRMVVDNDGNQFPIEKSGQVALQKGAHPFEADFIEGGGGFTLTLEYSLNGAEPMAISDNWFGH